MLSVNQVALRLNVSKMTVYRLIYANKMPALQVGRSYRIEERDFADYLRKVRTRGRNASGRAGSSQARGFSEAGDRDPEEAG